MNPAQPFNAGTRGDYLMLDVPEARPIGSGYVWDAAPGSTNLAGGAAGSVIHILSHRGGSTCCVTRAWIRAAARPYTWLDCSINPPAGFNINIRLDETFFVLTQASNGLEVIASESSDGSQLHGTLTIGPRGPNAGVMTSTTANLTGSYSNRGFIGSRSTDLRQWTWEIWILDGLVHMSLSADGWHAGLFYNLGQVNARVAHSTHNVAVDWMCWCTTQVNCATPSAPNSTPPSPVSPLGPGPSPGPPPPPSPGGTTPRPGETGPAPGGTAPRPGSEGASAGASASPGVGPEEPWESPGPAAPLERRR